MSDLSNKAGELLDHFDSCVTDFIWSSAIHDAMWDVLNSKVTDLDGFLDAVRKHSDEWQSLETLSKEETLPFVRSANEHWHNWARTLKSATWEQMQAEHDSYCNCGADQRMGVSS